MSLGDTHKVYRSTEAIERFGVRRHETFCTERRFRDHAELLAEVSVKRGCGNAARFAGGMNIVIPMNYELALF